MSSVSEDILYYKDALADLIEAAINNETVQIILQSIKHWGEVAFENPTFKTCLWVILVITLFVIGHSLIQTYRAWNSQVKITWDEDRPPRVGENATLKIFFYPPPSPEVIGNEFLSKLFVRVVHDTGHEVETEVTANNFERAIYARFQLEKAGKYTITVLFKGYPVGRTPFTISVESDRMDPTKTLLSIESPIITTQDRVYRLDITPIDEYGNKCSATNDDLMRLSVELERLGDKENTKVDEAEMISSFGLRRADTSANSEPLSLITLNLKPKQAGVYFMKLVHNSTAFPSVPSKYEVIVLTEDEDLLVMLNAMENKQKLSTITFPAIWTEVSSQDLENDVNVNVPMQRSHVTNDWINTTIQLELTPKFVYFRGMKTPDSIVSTIIMTFRVSPQTRVEVIDQLTYSDDNYEYAITILDGLSGYSAHIWMPATKARIFYALFTKFVREFQYGSQQSFDSKREVLFKKLREQKRPHGSDDGGADSSFAFLRIKRGDEIQSTLEETKFFRQSDWRRPFIVSYSGEKSTWIADSWIFWAESVLTKLFENNSFGLFYSLGSSKLIHPNPKRNPRWTIDHYELAGKIVGKYLFEVAQGGSLPQHDCFVNARFTRSFLAQILSFMPTYKHLHLDLPDVYQHTVKHVLAEDVSSMNLHFTGPYYDELGNIIGLKNLIPDGNRILVTNENKAMYLDELAKVLLQQDVEKEVEAFVFGLNLLVPQELLMSFTENEIELLICGCSKWTMNNFKKYVTFPPETVPHASRLKEWLLESLREMDFQDKGLFLQFLTGSSRLPPEGLSQLNPRIKVTLSCLFGQLHTADQINHILSLSDHTTQSEFAAALLAAIRGQLH